LRASDGRETGLSERQSFVVVLARQFERGAATRAERDVADNRAKCGSTPLQRRLAGRTRLADAFFEHWCSPNSFTLTQQWLTKPYWAIAELTLKMHASSGLDARCYALVIARIGRRGFALVQKRCAASRAAPITHAA
jgi:hypothetical protein